MTNVSKKPLPGSAKAKLVHQLAVVFSDLPSTRAQALFEDLLTPAEQMMLIKRLAIVLLLHQQQSVLSIARALSVSDATVRQIRMCLQAGDYQHIIKRCSRKQFNSAAFWKALELVLSGGLPSRGKDRWNWMK